MRGCQKRRKITGHPAQCKSDCTHYKNGGEVAASLMGQEVHFLMKRNMGVAVGRDCDTSGLYMTDVV
jgi:hypothetical protein